MSVNEWALLFVAGIALFCAVSVALVLMLDRWIARTGRRK